MMRWDRRLGERLAELRRRRGMTQETLAERSDVSVSVIRKLERGERNSAGLSTLRKLASALGVPTMELFAPAPVLAGPVDEYERDDLYELRRVLQPPRGVDGASVLPLAEDDRMISASTVLVKIRIDLPLQGLDLLVEGREHSHGGAGGGRAGRSEYRGLAQVLRA